MLLMRCMASQVPDDGKFKNIVVFLHQVSTIPLFLNPAFLIQKLNSTVNTTKTR